MAAITRLQVIALRDKGVITPERAQDWLAILDKGGILDVAQKFVDQAPAPETLLPIGVTRIGEGEIEIDFKTVTREGLLKLNEAGVLNPEQTVSLLKRQRESAARPTSIGGKLVDAAQFAFNPFDPRGVIEVGGLPVKAGLAATGIAAALPTLALGGPAAIGPATVTGVSGIAPGTSTASVLGALGSRTTAAQAPRIPGAVAGIGSRVGSALGAIGRQTGIRPLSLGRLGRATVIGAPVAGAGLATAAALTGKDAPPPGGQGTGAQAAPPQGQAAKSAAAKLVEDAFAGAKSEGGSDEDAEAAGLETAEALGVDVQYITRQVRRFNPGTGQIEEIDSIIPIITEQVPDGLGGFITQSSAGAPFFPELAKGQFELEQGQLEIEQDQLTVAQEERQRRDLINSLPKLTEFFAQLADPKIANLLRISTARAGGQPTVSGLNLPAQLGALFGLQPGQELPSGVQGDTTGGFLSGLQSLLGGSEPITGPALEAQITPGTAQGLGPEGLGALQAALIGSGTNLAEEQRKARRSALPRGR